MLLREKSCYFGHHYVNSAVFDGDIRLFVRVRLELSPSRCYNSIVKSL